VKGLRAKRFEIPFDGDFGINCGELLAELDLLAVVEQALAIHLAFYFGGAFQKRFH